jgi:hypothetical protein
MVFMLHIRSRYSPNPLSILRFPVDCNSSKLSFMLFKRSYTSSKVLCTCHVTAARAGGPALKAEVKSSKMAGTCTFNEVWSENTVKMGFGLWTCKFVHDIECSTQGLVNSSYCF